MKTTEMPRGCRCFERFFWFFASFSHHVENSRRITLAVCRHAFLQTPRKHHAQTKTPVPFSSCGDGVALRTERGRAI
ncbi:hypothetical protein GCK32_015699 [Trichostrongylus colubriformis]|uniref:Uncharacterized protein n=1 Tax=Trichostrongylus colubriformis TaxID=6319 RepID=A0AAN8FZT2_TRICO